MSVVKEYFMLAIEKFIEENENWKELIQQAPYFLKTDEDEDYILMCDDDIIFSEELKLPHPEMHKRVFVLEPLAQIEPYLVHPIKNMNVTELLEIAKKDE